MSIKRELFGTLADGTVVERFTMTNANDIEVQLCTYGGIITSIKTPNNQGAFEDIVLGFDSLDEYVDHNPYFGCLVGRYANRIAKGHFELEGQSYTLAKNDGPNHLHGGAKGFDKVVWGAKVAGEALKLNYLSPDGEEGYPGNLTVEVSYTLTDSDEFQIDYKATTDTTTIINLTNHSYFNLSAETDILNHEIMLNAEQITPIDETFIPTGNLQAIHRGPFDFREYKLIGGRIFDSHDQLQFADGYDHNWVLNRHDEALSLAASVRASQCGRQLDVFTTLPGVQFYSGNLLPELKGKGGQIYKKHAGFCLETQHFPDSPNQANFPSVVLNPKQIYKHSTVLKFSVIEE